MPDNQAQTNEVIFKKIDEHGERIASLETFKEVTRHRLENGDRRHDEICGQLVRTETKVMEKLGTQEKMLTDLNNEKLMAQGAKNQWKAIGALVAIVYTALQLAILIKTFSGG